MTEVPLADWWTVARGKGAEYTPRSEALGPVPLPAHPGLWIDRCLAQPFDASAKGWPGRERLYEVAVRSLRLDGTPEEPPAVRAYRDRFAAWRSLLDDVPTDLVRRTLEIEARSRLLLHPATGGSVTEGSILLHHTYGVPYLPGSALKGVLRARLEAREIGESAESSRWRGLTAEILGRRTEDREPGGEQDADPSLASLIDFLDALWIPEPPPNVLPGWSPLALDVVTPHHPDYYTASEGRRKAPQDGDDPIPVQRLSVAPGTRFLIAVEAPNQPTFLPWLDWLLEDVLMAALREDGLGAWTSIGYGRLDRLGPRREQEAAGSASSAGERPPATQWARGAVAYRKDRRELTTTLPGGRRATAREASTQGLLEALPERIRTALVRRGKSVELLVQVVPEGASFRLAGARMPEEDAEG